MAVFTVRVIRSDRDYIDPVRLRAATRDEAEAFAREMFGERFARFARRGERK
jgi:hypothetical protein